MEKIKNFLRRYYKRIISVLILVIFIILMGACVYLITLDDGAYKVQDMSSTPYAASTYVASVKFTGEGIKFIYVNKDTGLEEEKTSSEMAKIVWDEMIKAGSNVGRYLDNVEQLEKLMNAEIITQYPRLPASQVKPGYLNGTIDFIRHKKDDSTVTLKYLKLDDFKDKIEKEEMDVLDYYTLDDNDNLLVGVIDETTEELTSDDDEMIISDYSNILTEADGSTGNYKKTVYSVYSKAINYKMQVSKFTMPFQYLWAFIVIGDDNTFALDLADLVEKSDIDISIFDNITTTVNTNTFTYTKERRVDVSATATAVTNGGTFTKSKDFRPAKEWVDGNYKVVHKTTYKNNTLIVDITKADVWIVDYSKKYTYKKKAETKKITNNKDLDDTDYKKDAGSPQTSGSGSDLPFYDKFQDKLQELVQELDAEARSAATPPLVGMAGQTEVQCSTSITSCVATYYKKFTNRKGKYVTDITKQKYITSAGDIKNEPKVKKKTAEQIKNGTGQDNFVTILCDPSHADARFKITEEITGWLFDILEGNPDTVNMVELTKFLLYKVTGNSYGPTEYDFSEFETENFAFAGSAGGVLSLTTPTLDKSAFVAAMQAYGATAGNANFNANFLPYAAEIYDWSVASGVNPELVVITAKTEGGFGPAGGQYNYWGLGTPNGASSGASYGSLQEGIQAYAQSIQSFQTGWRAERITQEAAARQAAGVDPLGYGAPDTLSGMQSLYSDLGKHEYGSPGAGGYYYMDPARAGVTKIYATHEEFESKCASSGLPEHALGTPVTTWENGQYTAWQVEQKLKVWAQIFGSYGSLPFDGSGGTAGGTGGTGGTGGIGTVTGGNANIVSIAQSKLGCPYVWGATGPDSFDCSGFVYWVYQQQGINVPRSTDGYKAYAGSATEISWSEAQPGDILIVFDSERGTSSGHAGIYIGNDQYIHSPQSGDVVKISSGAQSKFKHVFRFK